MSSAFLRDGPMPGTSSSELTVIGLAALLAVGADREAVRLVAQPLEVEQQPDDWSASVSFAPVEQVEDLAAFAAMMRPLGDADHRHVLDAELFQDLASRH